MDAGDLYRMIRKKERQNGMLEGFHGTSASRARAALENGFVDQRCVEGEIGIWFHDDKLPRNAHLHGQDKAREDGETEYAVIKARSMESRLDLRGRPQWVAPAKSLEILSVEFFKLNKE